MRISARSLATTLLAVGVASCSDSPIAAVKQGTGPGRAGFARLGFAPVFSKNAEYTAQHADEFGIEFDSVRVVIRNTPDTASIVRDTAVVFGASSAELTLDLQIPVEVDGQRFDALVQYLSPTGEVVYSGHSIVQSYPAGGTPPAQTPITINFVGPGARAAKIAVSPKTVSLVDGQTVPFTVTATDSGGSAIAAPPVAWSASDTSVVHISTAGVLTTAGRRATATVTATTPTGLSDNAAVTITLPAAGITLVSGGGQTGKVGTALASPAVVQVSASDGVGVAGVNVIFSPPTGGSVGVTSAVTDANGRASTTLRLGTVAGAQAFAATAAGFSVAIPTTAASGDPAAIAAVSGGGQTDTVLHALKQPLTVHVSDQYANPVAGVAVIWSRVGAGVLGASSSATNAEGNASVTYTLGGVVGGETVSASVAGVSAPVSFALNAIAGAPAQLVLSPATTSTLSIVAGDTLTNAPIVRTLDAANNAVAGVSVHFALGSVSNGTLVPVKDTTVSSDASGSVRMPAVRLTRAGAYTVAITSSVVPNVSLSLTAVVLPGKAARIIMPNGNTLVDTVGISPRNYPLFTVLDVYGNAVPNQNVTFTATMPCNVTATVPASDSSGTIAFANTNFVIPTDVTNPVSCGLVATTGSITANAYVIIASRTGAAWTGAVSSDWTNAANWSTGVLPTGGTPVYVPLHTANSPIVSADQSVASIVVADTAVVNLGGHVLTSYGSVDADSTGVITNGKLVLGGTGGTNLIRGLLLPATTCGVPGASGGSQYQLNGAVQFIGSLTLSSCTLTLNGNFAMVDSNFVTSGPSVLAMNNSSDVLYVSGNATFGGSGSVSLSDGQIVVRGSFTQTGSFSATGKNAVYLAGSTPATISMATPSSSHFNNLYVANTGTDSVHIASALFVDGTLALSAPVPLTIDSTSVTVNQLQLGQGTRVVLKPRAQLSAQACSLYNDPLTPSNNASIIGGVVQQIGNSQGTCVLTTTIPPITIPIVSTVTSLTSSVLRAVRHQASTARLR